MAVYYVIDPHKETETILDNAILSAYQHCAGLKGLQMSQG